jgi:hypothetical protein
VENYQLVLGVNQLSDTDGVAPNHLGRDLSWVIAGTENDDLGAGDLLNSRSKSLSVDTRMRS